MADSRIPNELRQQVIERAKSCCEYCYSQSRFAMQSFSIEHILPTSKGGLSVENNLALSCQGCNNHKYNKTEGSDRINNQIASLFHPRQHTWTDHFVWNEDYSLVIGITAIGRATVDTLQLNRDGLVNLRKVLYQMGEHPPL